MVKSENEFFQKRKEMLVEKNGERGELSITDENRCSESKFDIPIQLKKERNHDKN